MKLKKITAPDYLDEVGQDHEAYSFMCPGCQFHHRVITHWGNKSGQTEPEWKFNGDLEKPTFTPSFIVKYGRNVCHLWVTDGMLNFLGDSTHALAGQTVPIPEHD